MRHRKLAISPSLIMSAAIKQRCNPLHGATTHIQGHKREWIELDFDDRLRVLIRRRESSSFHVAVAPAIRRP